MKNLISMTVEGAPDLVARFSKVSKGVGDLRELGTWKAVRQEFYAIQKEVFSSEGAASKAGKWAPLSSKYAEYKAKKYGSKPILQASGSMYKEFTGSPASVDEQATEMTLGFSSPAGYHMSQSARSKMPYRTSLELTDEQNKRLLTVIKKKMEQLLDNQRLRDMRAG